MINDSQTTWKLMKNKWCIFIKSVQTWVEKNTAYKQIQEYTDKTKLILNQEEIDTIFSINLWRTVMDETVFRFTSIYIISTYDHLSCETDSLRQVILNTHLKTDTLLGTIVHPSVQFKIVPH